MIVCLITPPSIFLLDERVFVSLGILRVAACLEQAGHVVEMLDTSGISGYEEVARDHAAMSKAVYFGITATTPQLPAAIRIAKAIRSARLDVKIILGGPHITLINAAMKRECKLGMVGRAVHAYDKLCDTFDILVAGDGEDAIFEALQPDAPKLVDADIPSGKLFLTNDRLNEMPWPARHLVDMNSYKFFIENVRSTSLIAQNGCPFACGFCGGRESPMLRRIRMRTTENIIGEIRHIHTVFGLSGLMFFDDEMNVNPKMIELMNAIADLQQSLGVEFKLRGFVKSQLFNDQQAAAMHRAGFRWVLIGFESGSPRILENMNKKATRDDNTRCMEIAERHGLKVKALMSIGHPGESEQTVMQTRDWLLEVKPADFDATIITTYPGTPYFDHALKHKTRPGIWTYEVHQNGDKLHAIEVDFENTESYYKGKVGEYSSYVFTDYLEPEDMVRLRDCVETDVRTKLGIPFNQSSAAIRYEHSMGQSGPIPSNILRTSKLDTEAVIIENA